MWLMTEQTVHLYDTLGETDSQHAACGWEHDLVRNPVALLDRAGEACMYDVQLTQQILAIETTRSCTPIIFTALLVALIAKVPDMWLLTSYCDLGHGVTKQ
jgi:hypothetical protein